VILVQFHTKLENIIENIYFSYGWIEFKETFLSWKVTNSFVYHKIQGNNKQCLEKFLSDGSFCLLFG